MPSLHDLQTRVMDALLDASYGAAIPLVSLPAELARGRLAVYQSNVRGNFVDCLHCSFPAVWGLVGEEYFRQTAREFQRRHPSRSGDLLHAGRRFPDYLAELHAADRFAYLPDVARLEWLIQEALLSADHAPLELSKLAAVAPADYDALRFELHPALRLFESRYPVLRIWEANVGSEAAMQAEPEPIDLDAGADRLAVMSRRLTLQLHRLSPGEVDFLDALKRGAPFAAALNAGEASADGFDATAALQRFVALEAIVDCR